MIGVSRRVSFSSPSCEKWHVVCPTPFRPVVINRKACSAAGSAHEFVETSEPTPFSIDLHNSTSEQGAQEKGSR